MKVVIKQAAGGRAADQAKAVARPHSMRNDLERQLGPRFIDGLDKSRTIGQAGQLIASAYARYERNRPADADSNESLDAAGVHHGR